VASLTLVCAGRVKESYYEQAIAEYVKRLGAYRDTRIIELREVTPPSQRESDIAAALRREGELIIEKIPRGAYIAAMCVEGREMSSEELARSFADISRTNSHICIVVGSSNGLSPEVKNLAQLRLSLSKMTLPHSLARVVTLEQCYRAFSILEGGKYHK
jgi:23S rRNA (pseudouridine1915-N3)-methyltransferase